MAMRISLLASDDLLATVLLLKGVDRELAKQTRAAIKTVTDAEWREAVRGNVATRLETRVLADTARVAVSDQNVTLRAGAIGKPLSGGARPSEIVHSAEFGADQAATASYTANSSKGRAFAVKNRHSRRQFRPRNLKGYVVYPAASRIIPRIAALYVQTAVRTIYEALEGKR
jgi:hypothetical protein